MDPDVYTAILTVAAGIFCVGFVLTAYRVIIGPNSMDRVAGLDAIVAMLQCALAVYICWTLDTTVSNTMLVVALLGFISSLAVAKYHKKDEK